MRDALAIPAGGSHGAWSPKHGQNLRPAARPTNEYLRRSAAARPRPSTDGTQRGPPRAYCNERDPEKYRFHRRSDGDCNLSATNCNDACNANPPTAKTMQRKAPTATTSET